MTPDQAHTINVLIALVLIGLPVAVVTGGPYLWRAIVIVAGLGVLGLHPVAGFAFFLVIALWRPIKIFLEFLIGGYAAGFGFGRATRPRVPRRRSRSIENLQRYDGEQRPNKPMPRIKGFTPEQVRELQRRYPSEFGNTIDMG